MKKADRKKIGGPMPVKVHEVELAKPHVQLFQRLQAKREYLSGSDRQYFDENAAHFEQHGRVKTSVGKFVAFCTDRLAQAERLEAKRIK